MQDGPQIVLPSGSTITVNQDGSFTYTPATGFTGTDVFSYTITDGITTSTATVSILVTPF